MLKLNYISCRFIGFTMGRFFMLALALTNKKILWINFSKLKFLTIFCFQEGIVVSFASYVIDGTITKGFYTDTEAEELGIKTFHFLPFSMLRPRIFDLIKGKRLHPPLNSSWCCRRKIKNAPWNESEVPIPRRIFPPCPWTSNFKIRCLHWLPEFLTAFFHR